MLRRKPLWEQDRDPVLQRLCQSVSRSWKDPSASQETNDGYRSQQYQAVLHQLPVSIASGVVIPIVVLTLFRDAGNAWFLDTWASLIIGLFLLNLWEWQHHRFNDPSNARVWRLTAQLTIAGMLYSSIVPFLFRETGPEGRAVAVATVTAFIATGGWLYSALPRAGVAWVMSMCSSTFFGIVLFTEGHLILAGLLVYYCFTTVGGVLLTARTFMRGLVAQTEAEHQRQLVGLLLHDFEEHTSDWLWETDKFGHMRHVSASLAEALGHSPEELQSMPFIALVASLMPEQTAEDREMIFNLEGHLAGRSPFRDMVVAVQVSGTTSWWSLTAKPLINSSGQVEGWRGVGSDITILRQREIEMTRLANVDSLTRIPNRHQFNNHLAAHFADQSNGIRPGTLMLLDLDDFKTINDSLGHAAGDELLVEVAARLRSVVRKNEMIARIGGDEFVIFIPEELSKQQVESYLDRLRASLTNPWNLADNQIEVRASVGVGVVPGDAQSAEQLLRVCDMALYASKEAGRNTHRFFDPSMDARVKDKLSLLGDLRTGLANADLLMHYQPQVDMDTGSIVGFEALVRWQHPTRGMIPPDHFIPLAEESGLIVPLGTWIMNRVCEQAMLLPSHLSIAVNVSGRQFTDSDVLQIVRDALRHSGLPSHRLVVEVTESSLMADTETTQGILRGLRQMGVRVALDDFGTGYSSLSYLRTFPLDKIKIDRSFVSSLGQSDDSESAAIAIAIVQLAEALRLETIAEGIENVGQAELLRSIGCTHGQGYLYAKPLPLEQAIKLASTRPVAIPSDPQATLLKAKSRLITS